jgi:hypothetical protein
VIGSVSEKVVSHAKVPVLVVRAKSLSGIKSRNKGIMNPEEGVNMEGGNEDTRQMISYHYQY